ncbi:hypothetical protein IM697_27645 [Streptomyces ferrugineus]|uniref:Uncharacterized protein n=1 Tax=Streptomyces ferrugineus TaxID=1413221 RepID=A0A7M2SC91_9ACTN|nr:hypothetical protein [Streptomyces ferrugineus]QOV33944.1 hypothetical protein IM697_27645 [Streptomyces ferrugineus]
MGPLLPGQRLPGRAPGARWNALTTLHDANAGHGREVYAFLGDDCGATHLPFIPIVERATAHELPLADDGWGARAKDRLLYRQQGDRVAPSLCVHSRTCGSALAAAAEVRPSRA